MRPKNNPTDQENRTFIEAARRAQIIDCAIETIADLGYAQASLAQIAKRAKISKGVISYHFANKDELIGEVVRVVMSAFADFVVSRLNVEHTASGQLRVFIEANLAFMNTHRMHMLAMFDIINNARLDDGKLLISSDIVKADQAALEVLLREGQEQGEFREFDARIMAVSILSLRNGVLVQLAQDSSLDLNAYAREWATLFDLATRKNG